MTPLGVETQKSNDTYQYSYGRTLDKHTHRETHSKCVSWLEKMRDNVRQWEMRDNENNDTKKNIILAGINNLYACALTHAHTQTHTPPRVDIEMERIVNQIQISE